MRKHKIQTLKDLVKRSTHHIELFWDAAAKDLHIELFMPYEKVLDTSKGIEWARWFIGGELNIAHNCLDRHARVRGDKTAVIWQGEDGEVRKLSYMATDVIQPFWAIPLLGVAGVEFREIMGTTCHVLLAVGPLAMPTLPFFFPHSLNAQPLGT